MKCEIATGLEALRASTPNAQWSILSGGDQQELRKLFANRRIDHLFDGGIFGSPDNKDEVLARKKTNGNLQFPALYIGDSKYDYEAATRAGLDFIFLSNWTEVLDWQEFCTTNQVKVLGSISDLCAD